MYTLKVICAMRHRTDSLDIVLHNLIDTLGEVTNRRLHLNGLLFRVVQHIHAEHHTLKLHGTFVLLLALVGLGLMAGGIVLVVLARIGCGRLLLLLNGAGVLEVIVGVLNGLHGEVGQAVDHDVIAQTNECGQTAAHGALLRQFNVRRLLLRAQVSKVCGLLALLILPGVRVRTTSSHRVPRGVRQLQRSLAAPFNFISNIANHTV